MTMMNWKNSIHNSVMNQMNNLMKPKINASLPCLKITGKTGLMIYLMNHLFMNLQMNSDLVIEHYVINLKINRK